MDEKIWDLVIVGGGPAGLSAAIYAAREHFSTLILEQKTVGGMVASTEKIDNYPGFENGINGLALAENMKSQAKKYGAKIGLAKVTGLSLSSNPKVVNLGNGQSVQARAILIATGSDYRQLNIKGEAEMIGRGVHFCATCDAAFYKNRPVIVIGGGNSALEEALYISRFASKITIVSLTELTASAAVQAEIRPLVESGQIEVRTLLETLEVMSENGKITGIRAQTVADHQSVEIAGNGIFVFVGLVPNTDFLVNSEVKLDEQGFVIANHQNQTSVEGLFVAGDVKSKAARQAIVAAGDGAVAALAIRDFLQYNVKQINN